ncbi:response regulator [Candidatus Riflebacteria bacterium]
MKKVLIVDDDPKILDLLSKQLEKLNYFSEFISRPEFLFDILEAEAFDLILMDINMPGIDGLSLLKKIKEDQVFRSIPVIMLTGEVCDNLLAECFENGAIDFINKPVSELVLKSRINSVFAAVDNLKQMQRSSIQMQTAKEEAEAATKLKDKFVSLVAHDLKSPLSIIIGFSDLVQSELDDSIDEKLKKYLGLINQSAEHMVKMIEDLLNLTRLQTGKIMPKEKFLDSYNIIDDACSHLLFLAKQKGIEIENLVPPGIRVSVDPGLFSEVLKNIISNAIKFSSEGNRITITLEEKHDSLCFGIKDRGIGMSPNLLNTLFIGGAKVSRPGTKGEKGTGLGFTYSMEIVRAHGGSIKAESKEAEGSLFIIELPKKKPKILIVDDEKLQHILIQEIVEPFNVEIINAYNGMEALEHIQEGEPDLIILDFEMPVMDGFKLLKNLKKDVQLKKIPALMMTPEFDFEIREQAIRLGAEDFLIKPPNASELLPRLAKYII